VGGGIYVQFKDRQAPKSRKKKCGEGDSGHVKKEKKARVKKLQAVWGCDKGKKVMQPAENRRKKGIRQRKKSRKKNKRGK